MSGDREQLRLTFDEVAELYDVARPGYPAQMVDDLLALSGVGRGGRVLEIGCGTGALSVALAARGVALTCVELGAALARVARRNLLAFGSATVEVAAFEDWSLPAEPFDLVVAATSFHWLDPDIRVVKSAAALRPRGCLAVVSNEHVAGEDAFFTEVQDCYVRWHPDVDRPSTLLRVDEVPTAFPELDESVVFGPVELRRYAWDETYSTPAYLDLLATYSGHRALPEPSWAGLRSCIAELIDSRFAGRVTKSYLTELRLARTV